MAREGHKGSERLGCREFDENLTAYLEGEESSAVRSHAEKCSSCGSLLADLELLRSAAKDLPLESPSPRVWSNIRANLAQEGFFRDQQSFWQRWFGQFSLPRSAAPAAALAVALLIAVMLVFRGDFRKGMTPSPSEAVSSMATATRTVPVGLTSVQANLVRTVEEMETSYKSREATLDPSAKQIYQKGLDSLNNSINECLDSLQKQPGNMLVREYLMQAYSQKAAILASALEYGGR